MKKIFLTFLLCLMNIILFGKIEQNEINNIKQKNQHSNKINQSTKNNNNTPLTIEEVEALIKQQPITSNEEEHYDIWGIGYKDYKDGDPIKDYSKEENDIRYIHSDKKEKPELVAKRNDSIARNKEAIRLAQKKEQLYKCIKKVVSKSLAALFLLLVLSGIVIIFRRAKKIKRGIVYNLLNSGKSIVDWSIKFFVKTKIGNLILLVVCCLLVISLIVSLIFYIIS